MTRNRLGWLLGACLVLVIVAGALLATRRPGPPAPACPTVTVTTLQGGTVCRTCLNEAGRPHYRSYDLPGGGVLCGQLDGQGRRTGGWTWHDGPSGLVLNVTYLHGLEAVMGTWRRPREPATFRAYGPADFLAFGADGAADQPRRP